MIEPRRSPASVAAAIDASARRAWMLAGIQATALVAIVAGQCLGSGGTARPDASVDAPGGGPPDGGGLAMDAQAAPCANHAACRAACDDGGPASAESCVRLADMLRTGTGGAPARDRLGARERYREACFVSKDTLSCTHLALAAGLSRDLDLAPDWLEPQRAPLGLLAAACADRDRGVLACAALELRRAPPALGRDGRDGLCHAADGGADGTDCAARLALAACRGTPADAEACALAAAGELPTAADAGARLEQLCKDGDLSACLYRYEVPPPKQRDPSGLFTACSELENEKARSIAGACVARARTDPRQQKFADQACELGACQGQGLAPRRQSVLQRSCDAGRVNGCANLLYQRRGEPAARKAVLEQVRRLVPRYADRAVDDRSADQVACELGSLDGCNAAIARLALGGAADKQLAETLRAYRGRILEPLSVP